jgi:hypothetical protein
MFIPEYIFCRNRYRYTFSAWVPVYILCAHVMWKYVSLVVRFVSISYFFQYLEELISFFPVPCWTIILLLSTLRYYYPSSQYLEVLLSFFPVPCWIIVLLLSTLGYYYPSSQYLEVLLSFFPVPWGTIILLPSTLLNYCPSSQYLGVLLSFFPVPVPCGTIYRYFYPVPCGTIILLRNSMRNCSSQCFAEVLYFFPVPCGTIILLSVPCGIILLHSTLRNYNNTFQILVVPVPYYYTSFQFKHISYVTQRWY